MDEPRILNYERIEDNRGWFMPWGDLLARSFNHKAGTVRGLHYQPGQGKAIWVIRGAIYDVAYRITDGETKTAVLEASGPTFYIPPGYAHGFCTLEDETEVLYKFSHPYDEDSQGQIHWQKVTTWPEFDNYILSERDK